MCVESLLNFFFIHIAERFDLKKTSERQSVPKKHQKLKKKKKKSINDSASVPHHLLLIDQAQASVELPPLFPGIPDGEAFPLAENSLLQKVNAQLPDSLPDCRKEKSGCNHCTFSKFKLT